MTIYNFIKNRGEAQEAEFQEYFNVRKKLNLGCNVDIRPDYVNIDIIETLPPDVVIADVSDMYFIPNGSCTDILAYDLLEHLPFSLTVPVLKHWIAKLAPEGRIIVRTPDLARISKKFQTGELPVFEMQRLLFGGQEYKYNFHYAGFTSDYLEGLVLGAGCSKIVQVVKEPDSYNCTIVGIK